MCDYSLYTIPNRLAQDGEELVLYKFATGTLGFASVPDLKQREIPATGEAQGFWSALKNLLSPRPCCGVPAICIPPGARLRLTDIPRKLQNALHVGSSETVVFSEISSRRYSYRDALMFPNGREVLLQYLPEGLCATVLSTAPEAESSQEQEAAALYV